MKKVILLVSLLSVLGLSSCGDGRDPLQLFKDPTVTPALVLPVDPLLIAAISAVYTTSNDGFDFTVNVLGTAVTVRAPTTGTVVAVENADNLWSVTLYHNPSYSTRVSKMTQMPSVRLGDQVAAGGTIGSTTNASVLHFSVFDNALAVCPYSFLDTASRQRVDALTAVPCQ